MVKAGETNEANVEIVFGAGVVHNPSLHFGGT